MIAFSGIALSDPIGAGNLVEGVGATTPFARFIFVNQAARIAEPLVDGEMGDVAARDVLFQLIYDELRAMARNCKAREAPGQVLRASAFVSEVDVRLCVPHSERSAGTSPDCRAARPWTLEQSGQDWQFRQCTSPDVA
jgi:hypothetical protein